MNQVENWLDEWLELWPSNIRWDGVKIRSKPSECIHKFKRLLKVRPELTKEIIFEATKRYLTERENNDWKFTRRAYFFIKKNDESMLEQFCDDILEENTIIEQKKQAKEKHEVQPLLPNEIFTAPQNDFI